MNQSLKNDFIENHLFYELRMLLGAKKVIEVFDENDMGNVGSLLRDSIYLHARNLYNFFSGCARNDISVHEFIYKSFDVSLYLKYKTELHEAVLHIKKERTTRNRSTKNDPLAEMALAFADDIESLWKDWVQSEENEEVKQLLITSLEKAQKESDDDSQKAQNLFADKSCH